MKIRLAADDVVISILRFADLKKGVFTRDRETLHRAFFAIKEEFPHLMRKFTFRQGELFPDSQELDTALSNLSSTGVLNGGRSSYAISFKNLNGVFENFLCDLLKENGIDEDMIKRASELFSRLVSVPVV